MIEDPGEKSLRDKGKEGVSWGGVLTRLDKTLLRGKKPRYLKASRKREREEEKIHRDRDNWLQKIVERGEIKSGGKKNGRGKKRGWEGGSGTNFGVPFSEENVPGETMEKTIRKRKKTNLPRKDKRPVEEEMVPEKRQIIKKRPRKKMRRTKRKEKGCLLKKNPVSKKKK